MTVRAAVNAITHTNAAIERLEAAMLELPQAECDVVHSFAPGLYIRQVTLPADAVAVGHYQKTTHLNVLLKGRVTMIEPDGSHIERVAPLTYIAAPGRKVGYVHEEVIWLNIYATDETDVDKLEAIFLDKSTAWREAQKLISSDRAEDRADFEEVIASLGYTLALVREQSENPSDLIAFPPGNYGVKVGASCIEGRGLIATASFEAGEMIAPARIGGMRTPAGRFTNHAKCPNAAMLGRANGDIDLVAIADITGCRGGADGDEITIDYRHALAVNQRLRGAA